MIRRKLSFAAIALCLGNSPPAPLVEGSSSGVIQAIKAARSCGYDQLRVQFNGDVAMMFDEGSSIRTRQDKRRCIAKWTRANEKRLSISFVALVTDVF